MEMEEKVMMNNPTNPREAISQYIKDTREHFNPIFFQRNEDEIITELMNVIYSKQLVVLYCR